MPPTATRSLRRPTGTQPPLRARARLQLRRLDRRRLAAIALAILGAVLSARAIATADRVSAEWGEYRTVLTARRALPAGTTLSDEDVVSTRWPAGLVPDGAIVDGDRAITGHTVRSDIGQGEVLTTARILGDGDLAATERALTIPQPLAPPPLDPGVLVDLVGVAPGNEFSGPQVDVLGTCRVLANAPDGLTVGCETATALAAVQKLAMGSVEVLRTPYG